MGDEDDTTVTKHVQMLENTVEIEVWTAVVAASLAGRNAKHGAQRLDDCFSDGDRAVRALRERLGQTSDLRAEVEKQRTRADDAERRLFGLEQTLSEAFNSGDGSYRHDPR